MDYYDQLIEFLDSKEELEMQRRREIAQPIPPEAERAHQQILPSIQEFSDSSIERTVYSSEEMDKVGCIFECNRRLHILVRQETSKFSEASNNYIAFKEVNENATPRDYFNNIVAHEYGHIIFNENYSSRLLLQLTDYFQRPEFDVPRELNEGFAFFFADNVTGFTSPLERLLTAYKNDGLDGDRIKGIYNELQGLGKNALKQDNLYDVALRYQ